MIMRIVPIEGFLDYYVCDDGTVWSNKSGEMRKLATWHGKNNKYKMVGLMKDGKRYRMLVHRLVAQAFIPNPNKLPIVNHKDADVSKCSADNLEWVTVQQNMLDCFSRHSQIRNFRRCKLYEDNKFISEFNSIKEAIRYAAQNYQISPTMLEKHRHHKNISIEV